MILRIVAGMLAAGTDAGGLLGLRDRLTRSARDVAGLDSLIVGVRPSGRQRPGESAVITVWRDAESMLRATGVDEADRFLGTRLRLELQVERAEHYEIVGRTFAALPPDDVAYVRVVRVRSRPNQESDLMDTLREQQPRLVDLGLIASHVGLRVVGKDVEAVSVGVWPDDSAIDAAASGGPDYPLYHDELQPWADRLTVEAYEGLEIAPRLPAEAGPPIFIIDDDLRIVDITASAAARLGWPAADLVGRSVRDLSLASDAVVDARHGLLLAEGTLSIESIWHIPDAGSVYLRLAARRDVPIPGRHTVLVRRHSDAQPTAEDLDAALAVAFPSMTPTAGEPTS
jgi:PAS domain-containing protein